jgi:hypothetical protein
MKQRRQSFFTAPKVMTAEMAAKHFTGSYVGKGSNIQHHLYHDWLHPT